MLPGATRAVGVDDDHDRGRRRRQVAHPVVERIALAAPIRVMALDDLGTAFCGDGGGPVAAVVGDDKEPVAASQLRQDGVDRCGDACGLVVGRHQDGRRRARLRGIDRQGRDAPACRKRPAP